MLPSTMGTSKSTSNAVAAPEPASLALTDSGFAGLAAILSPYTKIY